MYRKPEEILSQCRIIHDGGHEFMRRKLAVEAVESARLEVAEFFISLCGKFGHYEFFTKELWRNVKGFKNEDKAEVIAAFLHYWFHNEYGFNTCPCGSGWFSNFEEEEYYNKYIEKYKPLFKAYNEWCIKQR